MFAQTAVFMALVAFVNSMPITEHHLMDQGVQTFTSNPPQIGTQPFGVANGIWKRESPLGLGTDADIEILKSSPTTSKPPPPPHGTGSDKGPVELAIDFDTGVNAVHPKRNGFLNFFRKLKGVITGRDVANKQIKARSVVIDPELLAELQALVNVTVTLLRAEGKDSFVDPFQTRIGTLKSKVESGAVPTGELMSAAHGIASSYL
ncbi:hypothetical protein BDM02DRAFT_3121067 [Thelephora ganbajun]|uniref:Uncharacterized protein n=1 Tax=Thelephora ganbajun TaxID=370292 RepID=A0ACB6Z6Z6_THEGA|nr:hypothetical protein BDM02DRAFT_3121067 [Thelephora ganbajun]